jgi:hypothetical protein
MLIVVLVGLGALVAIAMLLTGDLTVDLSPQSSILLFILVAALGGVIAVVGRRIQALRSDERTHLEAMSEGQAQEQVWLLGCRTQDASLMREMVSAAETLNRGKVIPETSTNQHIEQARLEVESASTPPANALSPAVGLLQALSKRSNGTKSRGR